LRLLQRLAHLDRVADTVLRAPLDIHDSVADVAKGLAAALLILLPAMYFERMSWMVWPTVWRIENSMSAEMVMVPFSCSSRWSSIAAQNSFMLEVYRAFVQSARVRGIRGAACRAKQIKR
jgi:hypothetical protein